MPSRPTATRASIWRPTQGESWAIFALAGATVALLFFLYVIPVPHALSFRQVSFPEGTAYVFDTPAGSVIQCTWSTGHGATVYLLVQNPQEDTVYASWSANGSFAFTADQPWYLVSALGSFQISGTYYGPTL